MLSNRVQIERDSKIHNLENNVFSQMAGLIEPEIPKIKKDNIVSIGLEEALKELLELKKSQRDRTAG